MHHSPPPPPFLQALSSPPSPHPLPSSTLSLTLSSSLALTFRIKESHFIGGRGSGLHFFFSSVPVHLCLSLQFFLLPPLPVFIYSLQSYSLILSSLPFLSSLTSLTSSSLFLLFQSKLPFLRLHPFLLLPPLTFCYLSRGMPLTMCLSLC